MLERKGIAVAAYGQENVIQKDCECSKLFALLFLYISLILN